MHYKIFLDTNIYDASNYSFRNGLFSQLKEYAVSDYLELQINSVVKGEVERHIKKTIKAAAKDLNAMLTSHKLALFRTLPKYDKQMTIFKPDAWVKDAIDEFHDFLSVCKCEEISCNGIDVEGILRDYFNLSYPFEESKKDEFPDAIAVASIIQEINKLSSNNVFKDYKNSDGISDDLLYCVVSADNGFTVAIQGSLQRPNEDVKYFASLNELVNFIVVQDENAAKLQERLEQGFAKDIIEGSIRTVAEEACFIVDDPDGLAEDVYFVDADNINYYPYLVSLQKMSEGHSVARVYIEASFDVELDYEYLNENESYWDKEERRYLWKVVTEKVARYEARTELSISVIIDEEGNPEFNDYIEMPQNIDVDDEDLIEVLSVKEK